MAYLQFPDGDGASSRLLFLSSTRRCKLRRSKPKSADIGILMAMSASLNGETQNGERLSGSNSSKKSEAASNIKINSTGGTGPLARGCVQHVGN